MPKVEQESARVLGMVSSEGELTALGVESGSGRELLGQRGPTFDAECGDGLREVLGLRLQSHVKASSVRPQAASVQAAPRTGQRSKTSPTTSALMSKAAMLTFPAASESTGEGG